MYLKGKHARQLTFIFILNLFFILWSFYTHRRYIYKSSAKTESRYTKLILDLYYRKIYVDAVIFQPFCYRFLIYFFYIMDVFQEHAIATHHFIICVHSGKHITMISISGVCTQCGPRPTCGVLLMKMPRYIPRTSSLGRPLDISGMINECRTWCNGSELPCVRTEGWNICTPILHSEGMKWAFFLYLRT